MPGRRFPRGYYARKRLAGHTARSRLSRQRALLARRRMSVAGVRAIARTVVSRSKETHERTQSSSLGTITSSGSLTRLSQIGQGDGDDDRMGDVIKASYIEVDVVGEGSSSSGSDPTNPARIMLVRSKKRYDSSALSTSDMPNYYEFLTEEMREKFEVLADVKFMAKSQQLKVWNGSAVATTNLPIRFQKFIKRKLSHTIRWDDANTASNQNAVVGDLYLWITGRGASGDLEGVTYASRFLYKDS